MRASDPLNRTFRPKTDRARVKPVNEKHYDKHQAKKRHAEKSTSQKSLPHISTVCPHCGKTIEISIK